MIATVFCVVVSSGHRGHVAAWTGSTPGPDPDAATTEVVDVVSTVILRESGYDVSFYEYPGGHRVTPDVMERMVRWIEERADRVETSDATPDAGDGDARR